MNKFRLGAFGLTAACLAFHAQQSFAQEEVDDDVYELSPFSIDASDDEGYVATETLSGTRLRGQIRDTPVALSVLTQELMDEIGATDIDSMAEFVPSTRVYTAVGGDEFGNSTKGGDILSVRGFKTNTRLRNFFDASTFSDSYVTNRITFARGPNALLFGIGNPGGSVHISTNRANFGNRANSGSVTYQYETLGSHRLVLDQNKVLIEDRLALRVNFLRDEGTDYRLPTYDHRDGLYLTTTIRPFNNNGATQIRLNYEKGKIHRVRARPWAPFDQFSTWAAAGSPLYDNVNDGRPSNTPSFSNPFQRRENTFIDIVGQDAIDSFRSSRGGGFNSYVRSVGPIVNGQRVPRSSIQEDFVAINPLDTLLNHFDGDQSQLDAWLDGLGDARSIPDMWANGAGVAVNRNVFFSGPFDTFKRNTDNYTMFLEQKIGENLFVELAANIDESTTDDLVMMRSTDYTIYYDPNLYMPFDRDNDGEWDPNPYAGMPYVGQDAFATNDVNDAVTKEYRATASYNLDLRGERRSWLNFGRHQLSALYNVKSDDNQGGQLRPAITRWNGAPIHEFNNAAANNGVRWGGARSRGRYYLLPGGDPYIPEPWVPINGDPEVQAADWIWFRANRRERDLDSMAFATQSFLFNDRLVLTYGWREDRLDRLNSGTIRYTLEDEDPANGMYYGESNPEASFANMVDQLELQSWQNRSAGAVVHLLKDQGSVTNLSLYVNEATSVSGEDTRWTIDQFRQDPLGGEGKDYGIKFGLFDNTIVGSFGLFETSQTNAFSNTNFVDGRGPFLSIYDSIEIVDPLAPVLIRRDDGGTFVPFYDSTTEGVEFQAVWNVNENLRLRLTYSEEENVRARFADDIRAFYSEWRPQFDSFVAANYDPDFPGPVDADNPTVEEQMKIDAEFLMQELEEYDYDLSLKDALNGVPTFGIPEYSGSFLFSYRFNEGKLKGFSFGGGLRLRGSAPVAFEADENGVANVANQLRTEARTTYDANLAYKTKIADGKYTLILRANVRNLANQTKDIQLYGLWDRDTESFMYTRNQMVAPRLLILSTELEW